MVTRRLSYSLAIWHAWVLAGAVGTLLPTLPVLTIPFPTSNLSLYGSILGVIVSATCLAFVQYVVIRTLLAEVSLTVAMWIPVSVIATVMAVLAIDLWQITVPRTLISISAIGASLPRGFPMVEVVGGLFGVALAAFLGLSQGIVLSKALRRDVVGLWLLANLAAALLVGVILGIRYHDEATLLNAHYNLDEAAADAFFLTNTLLSGALYAAVTGPALLALSRGRLRTHERAVDSAVGAAGSS